MICFPTNSLDSSGIGPDKEIPLCGDTHSPLLDKKVVATQTSGPAGGLPNPTPSQARSFAAMEGGRSGIRIQANSAGQIFKNTLQWLKHTLKTVKKTD